MNPLAIGLIVFVCVFGGAMFGTSLRQRLPEHLLNADSKEVVRMAMGLIGTMAALVLGLLVAAAVSSYETQKNELTEISAKIVLLDHLLAHYGPETEKSRVSVRSAVARMLDQLWPHDGSQHSQEPTSAGAEVIYNGILELTPKDDSQRLLKAQALNIALELGRARWLMFEQESIAISKPLLAVVVFWLTISFISFGLFAPRNVTVITTLFVCALSVSGAIFLIMELYSPFQGLIQISSAPLRSALAHLGQ